MPGWGLRKDFLLLLHYMTLWLPNWIPIRKLLRGEKFKDLTGERELFFLPLLSKSDLSLSSQLYIWFFYTSPLEIGWVKVKKERKKKRVSKWPKKVRKKKARKGHVRTFCFSSTLFSISSHPIFLPLAKGLHFWFWVWCDFLKYYF